MYILFIEKERKKSIQVYLWGKREKNLKTQTLLIQLKRKIYSKHTWFHLKSIKYLEGKKIRAIQIQKKTMGGMNIELHRWT